MCCLVPISCVLFNSGQFLERYMYQDHNVSQICQKFLRVYTPALFLDSLNESYSIYFTAMEKSYLPMLI